MKTGRKATPTALKKLHGNPGRRALPKGEPQPGGLSDVKPPAHLSPAAKSEWRRLMPELIGVGLLTVADLAAFTAYCAAWGDFVEADRHLRTDGLVLKGKEGQAVRSPWFLVKAKAVEQIVKLGDRFGLSPSARAGLGEGDGAPGQRLGVPGAAAGHGSLAAYLEQKPDRLS
jgi:P27 family predicted phage terminase small subunit